MEYQSREVAKSGLFFCFVLARRYLPCAACRDAVRRGDEKARAAAAVAGQGGDGGEILSRIIHSILAGGAQTSGFCG